MKRRYFLRGLGIGIFVTALLFTIALVLSPPTMSDARIKKEAKKLGMVEAEAQSTETDELPVEDPDAATEKKVKETAAEVEKEAEEAKSTKEEADKEKQQADEAKTEADAKKQEAEEKKAQAEEKKAQANESMSDAEKQLEEAKKAVQSASSSTTVTGSGSSSNNSSGKEVSFVVESGQASSTVSANLYKAGLVDDATSFDRYLEQHNLDNNVQNGTFSIKEGSTYEEIAKTLTGK